LGKALFFKIFVHKKLLVKKYIPFSILLLCILMLLKSNLFTFKQFPLQKHAWSQIDHYSLSLGFVENDLNFFKPKTRTYNYKYPEDWKRKKLSTTTSVDFPIHQFIPAVVMKITGSESQIINRIYIYLYSLFGIFFLFKLSNLLVENKILALFPVLILIYSPLFVYYQNGFMPSIPSFSNFVIGTYFYIKFIQSDRKKYWVLALIFLSLAVLARTSYLFLYFSILGVELIRYLNVYSFKSIFKSKFLIGSLISFTLIFSYFAYNYYLRKTYGSLFLSHLMLPKDYEEFKEIVRLILQNWKYIYFSKSQYLAMGILALLAIIFYRRRTKIFINKLPIILCIFLWLASLAFFVSMAKQYVNHDYYFIDSFLFPVIFTTVILAGRIKTFKFENYFYLILIFISIFFLRKEAKSEQEKVYAPGPWNQTFTTYSNYENANKLLNDNNINPTETILCYHAFPPNLPFYLMRRDGIPIIDDKPELLKATIHWDFEYMLFENEYFVPNVYENYPEIINHFEVIDTDGKITLCKKRQQAKKSNLNEFLQLDKYAIFLESSDLSDHNWEIVQNNPKYGMIPKNKEFGAVYKNKGFSKKQNENLVIKFDGNITLKNANESNVVISIIQNGESVLYKSFALNHNLKKKHKANFVELIVPLPSVKIENAELGIYIWNPNHNEINYKDLGFKVYKLK
jgi:hypothetical protein